MIMIPKLLDLIQQKKTTIKPQNNWIFDIEADEFVKAIKQDESTFSFFASEFEKRINLMAKEILCGPAKLIRGKNETADDYINRIYKISGIR